MWPNSQFHLLKKSLMENFIFCAVSTKRDSYIEIHDLDTRYVKDSNPETKSHDVSNYLMSKFMEDIHSICNTGITNDVYEHEDFWMLSILHSLLLFILYVLQYQYLYTIQCCSLKFFESIERFLCNPKQSVFFIRNFLI